MRKGNGWKRYERSCTRKKRHNGRNWHHLKPVSRGGKYTAENLLLMHKDRHFFWHRIFGNMTLDEAIALLQRCKAMKHYEEAA